MRHLLLSFVLVCAFHGVAAVAHMDQGNGGGDGPKPLDPMSFFTTVKGNYRIELAGGSAPHGGDPTATVELESEEVVLTLPYCFPSGACDPGYVMIPFGRVNVVQDGLTFLISVTDGTTRYRYSWRWQTPDTVIFRNYQYRVDASTVITMEHVLKRKEIPFEAY